MASIHRSLLPLCFAIPVSMVATQTTAAVGGPDLFGYSFADQDDGAVYTYIDISTTGTLVASGKLSGASHFVDVARFTLDTVTSDAHVREYPYVAYA